MREDEQHNGPAIEGAGANLAQEIAAKEEEIRRLRGELLHLAAEFDNYRKQVARERESLAERALDQAVLAVLPAYDALERALNGHPQGDGDFRSLREGVERVRALAADLLARLGCVPYTSLGAKFDPLYHEVVAAEVSDMDKNVILAEFERGWTRGSRVIRPAKVKVSLSRTGGEEHGGDEGTSCRD